LAAIWALAQRSATAAELSSTPSDMIATETAATGLDWASVDVVLAGAAFALLLAVLAATLWGLVNVRRELARAREDLGHLAQVSSDLADERQRLTETHAVLAETVRTRDRLRSLIDTLPLPIWWRNRDQKLDGCNRAYARMLETTPEAVVQSGIEMQPGIRSAGSLSISQAAQQDRSGDGASSVEHVVVAGDRRALRLTEARINPAGDVAGFAVDVTDVEDAQLQLARHIGSHAEVLQNLETAIAIFGPDQRISLFNRAFARLWRLDEDWLAESPDYGEVLERLRETRLLPEQADWGAYKRGQLKLFINILETREDLMHIPDGRTVRAVTTPHPFGGLLFTFEDVTSQLVLERARNTMVAVQRATLDNMYEGAVVYGGDGRVDLYNSAMPKLWQLPDEFLASQPHISEVIERVAPLLGPPGERQERKQAALRPFFERHAQEGRFDRTDGSVIDFAAVPLPDGAMLFTYLDVTDSTRIERALRERNDALQTADHLKSEFLANVSYELRTPLNTILGFADILCHQYFGQMNERQTEYAQGILDSSHQLLMLINDILDLASIEAGHIVLEPERFNLHSSLESILPLVKERMRRKSLKLDFKCVPDIGEIEADERRIKQVLFNLLSNAIKFTPEGGKIGLGARRQAGGYLLWVEDNGIGIPVPEQQIVFDKFRKTLAGMRLPGAGLGLSLVRSFVEMHGGRLNLESVPDKGTRVTFTLPERAVRPGGASQNALEADAV
jgi:signal transduction histidine kinase